MKAPGDLPRSWGFFLWPFSNPNSEVRRQRNSANLGALCPLVRASVHDAGFRFEMLTARLLGFFVVVSALVSPGAEFAVARDAPANDFSPLLEWKNQIAADLEHNKRYLPGVRTRGKIGVVNFELNINRA